jgi:CRP-like cAMP-binding protein
VCRAFERCFGRWYVRRTASWRQGRVAFALLQLGETFGKDLPNGRLLVHDKVSQADLAGMVGAAREVGTVRENVSPILNTWKRNGSVSRVLGYCCIEKPEELKRLKAM